MPETHVKLPGALRPPFEVFVNGVPQTEGEDYEYRDGELIFSRALAKEGKLGFWRWFLGAWGVGTYRDNDTIDIRYELDGRPQVAHDIPFEGPPKH
jgi:hypothetical protein